jgi:serine/threonine protein phosphatase 1
MMRVLAVGDVHGCIRALTTLAEFVPFRDDDRIVMLGDCVDRGPDTKSVIEWLLNRDPICLRGNHEIMMLSARTDSEAREDWLASGGNETLASYSTRRIEEIPARHWDFLENGLKAWFETDTHFFVHANAYPELPLAEQPDVMLYWEPFNDPPPHCSGKIMVCGHKRQKSGVPRNIGHAVCIDTGAVRGGWLTCLDPASGRYWQADEKGRTRMGSLDDLFPN